MKLMKNIIEMQATIIPALITQTLSNINLSTFLLMID